jgi:hypothetical protein
VQDAKAREDNPDEDEWEENEEEEPMQLDDFEDQLAKDLELLGSDIVELEASPNILLRTDQLRALNAVITDALARYDYNEHGLMPYMFTVMGVRD